MKAEHQLETILQAFYISSIEANRTSQAGDNLTYNLVAHAADNLHKISLSCHTLVASCVESN